MRTTALLTMLTVLTVLLLAASDPTPKSAATTIILVRHAEKAAESGNPPLSERGKTRAEALAWMLGEQEIAAIYATPYLRTQQTGTPLAKAKGLSVQDYDPRKRDLLSTLGKQHAGETCVVVGHSNTVPELLRAAGVTFPQPLLDGYNDLFVLRWHPNETPTVLRLQVPGRTPAP